jgi:hypothetical protein
MAASPDRVPVVDVGGLALGTDKTPRGKLRRYIGLSVSSALRDVAES